MAVTVAAPVGAGPAPAAPHAFTVAKMLSGEGDYAGALAAFAEALALAPDDPYIRIEHAQLLARLAQVARSPRARAEQLQRAAAEAERARRSAPDNVDVLRALGGIYLELAEGDAAALTAAQEAFEAVRRHQPADIQALAALGRIYLDRGEPARAAELYRELVVQTPNNRLAYTFLVEALVKADQRAEAEKVLGELLAADPDSTETRLMLAELQSERGDHRAALATLLAAPPELRDEPRLKRQLASELYLTGDLDAALATAESLLAAQPDNQFLSLLRALVLSAQGQSEQALGSVAALRARDPEDASLAGTEARLLQRLGRTDEAARTLSDLAARLERQGKAAPAAEIRLELARLLFEARRFGEVLAAVRPLAGGEAADLADRTITAQAVLLEADALLELGRHGDALDLLARQTPSPLVTAKRAEALFRAGREAEARREVEGLATSEQPQAVLSAVQAYQRLERYDESIPLLERLVGREPRLATASFLLGAAYERTGRREQAVAAFRRALDVEPDFHAALNYLGYMWAERGENLEEALALVRRAVALDPDNGAYVDSLGWAHFQLGRHDEARALLERAARLEPEDPTVHEHLGDVYRALGQTERAREVYRRALELAGRDDQDDEDDTAEQVRQKLDDLDDLDDRDDRDDRDGGGSR